MRKSAPIIVAVVPMAFVGVIYECFLGHRHDYSGHLLAGYGATFAAAMFLMRVCDTPALRRRLRQFEFPFCLASIAGGAIAEATAFRIAKFDEIDFCNQSLGAVLAAICASTYFTQHTGESDYDHGLLVGIFFLGAGGVLAVA